MRLTNKWKGVSKVLDLALNRPEYAILCDCKYTTSYMCRVVQNMVPTFISYPAHNEYLQLWASLNTSESISLVSHLHAVGVIPNRHVTDTQRRVIGHAFWGAVRDVTAKPCTLRMVREAGYAAVRSMVKSNKES